MGVPETCKGALQFLYLSAPGAEVGAAPPGEKLADVKAAGERDPPVYGEDLAVGTVEGARVERICRAGERAEAQRVDLVRKVLERCEGWLRFANSSKIA